MTFLSFLAVVFLLLPPSAVQSRFKSRNTFLCFSICPSPASAATSMAATGAVVDGLSLEDNPLLQDFEIIGHLKSVKNNPDLRSAYEEVRELGKLSIDFSENVLDATKRFETFVTDKKEIQGLPATALAYVTCSFSGDLDNTSIIDQILKLRLEKAKLLDIEDLRSFCKGQGALEPREVNHWDINFWSERLCESKYDINEVWNDDVRFYRVKDSSGSPIAYFYFDPYSCPSEKKGSARICEVFSQSRVLTLDGATTRLPVVHMVCNQTPPVGDKPSLMTFSETVFHEFGHALQRMLTKQDEGLVAGSRGIEWDAVELSTNNSWKIGVT
ncbi:hypothetical protein CISIN_1g0187182mg, partial [Citrus sinensis]